jgi:hypothetical protein
MAAFNKLNSPKKELGKMSDKQCVKDTIEFVRAQHLRIIIEKSTTLL